MDDEIAERGEVVKKLYAERDIIGLGQIYCDHVMAMTAEELHAKSDIAAELAFRDAALAAKDREIAELKLKYELCLEDVTGLDPDTKRFGWDTDHIDSSAPRDPAVAKALSPDEFRAAIDAAMKERT